MNVDELMAEMAWVRRLAHGLLRDGDAADDIAQDAWLAASEHAPEDGRPLRPWLHRVVLNLVRMRARGDRRRSARELAGGEPPASSTADELLAQVQTQRVLADEVIALREPYRSTILLHYVEGLTSAEIARRLGIPSATVRQRLKHALDELRDRLRARADGPKQGWLAALVPLAHVKVQPPLAVGMLAMKKVLAVIVVIVLALLIGGVGWRALRSRGSATNEAGTRGGGVAGMTPRTLTTKVAGKELPIPIWIVQPGVPARRVAGRVVFAGKPVAGAKVRLGVLLGSPRTELPAMTPGPPFIEVAIAMTTDRGEFDFGMLPGANFVISAEADGKAPVSIGVAVADPHVVTDHLLLVLGECHIRVVGTVRDSASPVARARLKIAGLAQVESGADGKFSVCMPISRYPNINVEADGYGSINVQVPPLYGEFRRDFVLVPEATISGIVVDPKGDAVSGAVVSARPALSDAQDEANGRDTFTDEAGHFTLNRLAPTKFRMSALAGSGTSEQQPIVVAIGGTVSPEVRLVIVRRSRLRGRVSAAGVPVVGAHVGVDRTTFSGHSSAYAESQTDGSFILDGVSRGTFAFDIERYEVVSPHQLVVDRDDVADIAIEVVAKASLHGRITRHGVAVGGATIEGSPGDVAATAGADGTYVLAGLTPGTLALTMRSDKAFTDRTLQVSPGDQAVDFELDGGGEIDGLVVDESGAPVPAVVVHFTSTDQR
ncbi:MAG TPA: sigma-70 family RNA polymerase sigma factor, partial [Kofleriaceae bacterium]|nr:sigma-70 family RNA polymerase sigma factor [Kofleriaceae bacterium]